MLAPPSPVVVIPGITASELHDEYELPPEVLWSAVRGATQSGATGMKL